MIIAYCELGEEEYKSWDVEFSKAKTSVTTERDVSVDELADKIERDLVLLGATAVEDKLQKGVRIEKLQFHYLIFRLCAHYKFKLSLLSYCMPIGS